MFWSILVLKLRSKYIDWLGFCFHKLLICPPDVKRTKSFRGPKLTPWTPSKARLWIRCRAYNTLRPSPTFYNIQKLNLSSKTDISKTVWINPCNQISIKNDLIHDLAKTLREITVLLIWYTNYDVWVAIDQYT